MRVKILPAALADLQKGWRFYERQQEGWGDYFQESLFVDIDSLVTLGGVHRTFFGYHRLLSKKFPFAVYYRVEGGEAVTIWRVLDLRRHPRAIEKELSQGEDGPR